LTTRFAPRKLEVEWAINSIRLRPDSLSLQLVPYFRMSIAIRFAELDAQIDAGEASRQSRPNAKRKPKRRRPGPRLPAAVRKEIARFARELRQHRKLFIADPKLKDRAVRFLRSMLPPKRKARASRHRHCDYRNSAVKEVQAPVSN